MIAEKDFCGAAHGLGLMFDGFYLYNIILNKK